jgi:lysophospholipase L1-like esterase
VSIPPFAEDLDSTANFIIRRYNKVIEDLCVARHLTYLPLYERLSDMIRDHEHDKGQANFPHPSGTLSTKVALRHYFLWQNWDQISRAYGFRIHTDGIHLNTQGAEAVATLIQGWLAALYNRSGRNTRDQLEVVERFVPGWEQRR